MGELYADRMGWVPITVAARSKALTVLVRSKTEIVGSNLN
jgi:hypothetical protein